MLRDMGLTESLSESVFCNRAPVGARFIARWSLRHFHALQSPDESGSYMNFHSHDFSFASTLSSPDSANARSASITRKAVMPKPMTMAVSASACGNGSV